MVSPPNGTVMRNCDVSFVIIWTSCRMNSWVAGDSRLCNCNIFSHIDRYTENVNSLNRARRPSRRVTTPNGRSSWPSSTISRLSATASRSSCMIRMLWKTTSSPLTSSSCHRSWTPEETLTVREDVNTLKPRQNGRHFADDIFKCISLNENIWISIKISLKFVPKGPINNIPALVQIMAWRRPGDKPLSEPMMV